MDESGLSANTHGGSEEGVYILNRHQIYHVVSIFFQYLNLLLHLKTWALSY